ncbi:hypothetical protein INT46_008785 [Mucor plumbeus]|uniref:Uncharacterized protein n=1 Tax=Mucor plumbeus TaxID=97098 RepID=A0A8H7UWV0_9FUNG|nr:hypothetical protein INT46_008785 [Mucor plumbeus]
MPRIRTSRIHSQQRNPWDTELSVPSFSASLTFEVSNAPEQSTSNVVICPLCGRKGHKRRTHFNYALNSINQASVEVNNPKHSEIVSPSVLNPEIPIPITVPTAPVI